MKRIHKSKINLTCNVYWVIVFTLLVFGFQISKVEAQQFRIGNGIHFVNRATVVVNTDSLVNRGTLLNNGNGVIGLTGNLKNNGTFTNEKGSVVTLDGTTTQTIEGTIEATFSTLNLNNSAGLTLAKDATVNGNLNFQNGIITTGTNLLTVGDTGIITNAAATRYVDGKLANTFSTPGTKHFPIGKEGNYRPLTLQFSALTGTSIVEAEQFETPLTGDLPENTTLMTTGRHWKINQTGGSELACSITLDPTDYTPARPVVMLKQDNGFIISAATTTPTYTNLLAFTSFSEFGLGEECVNPDDGGLISGEQSSCNSFIPEEIKNEELPSGHIGELNYKWQMSITGSEVDFEDILGANDDSFSPGTVTRTTWYRRLARVDCDEDWDEAAASNVVKITIYETLAITCPLDLSVNNEASLCSASVTFASTAGGTPTPTLTYKLDGLDITSPHVFEVGTHTVVATAENVCGVVSCSFMVTVNDDESPEIFCPQNVTISCEDSSYPDAVGTATATDNCDANPAITYSDEITPGACTNTYTITRAWKATDVYENFSTCTQTITVRDITKPVVVVKDIVVELDPFGVATITHDALDNGSSDNCTPAVNLIFQTNITDFDCSHIGVNQAILTVTDECGNSDSKTANITVIQGNEILPPWENENTHASANGTASYASCDNYGTFYLTATGQSTTTKDVHHFVYQELCGNGTIIARLDDVKNGGWAGVMMRESTAYNAKTVLYKTRLYNPITIAGRRTSTGSAMHNANIVAYSIHWMKIERIDSKFKIYTSYNGSSWQLRHTATVSMNNCILAGIFTESVRSYRTSKAWLDNVEVIQGMKGGEDISGYETIITEKEEIRVDVYPNPADDRVIVSIPDNEAEVHYQISDPEGRLIAQDSFTGSELLIDLGNFKPGMYIIRLEIDGEMVNKRIVVM